VFRLSHAGEELAALLVADLIRNDPRFKQLIAETSASEAERLARL